MQIWCSLWTSTLRPERLGYDRPITNHSSNYSMRVSEESCVISQGLCDLNMLGRGRVFEEIRIENVTHTNVLVFRWTQELAGLESWGARDVSGLCTLLSTLNFCYFLHRALGDVLLHCSDKLETWKKIYWTIFDISSGENS